MPQKLTQSFHVGLDIGSTNVRCVVGVMEEDSPVPSIIGVGMAPNAGIRRGVVVDIEETVSAITAATDEAERVSGVRVGRATVGVNGSHIRTLSSHGVIAVGSGRDIGMDDVARVEEAASLVQLPPNREILAAYPRSYSLDGQESIKDPVGMSGMRLEVDTTLVTGATPFLKNLQRSVLQTGLSINCLVTNPVAATHTVLGVKQQEVGAVLLDIGQGTTGVAVYEEHELLHVAVIPIGSGHLTNDLAIGLRTDIETAEKIKLEYARDGKSSKAAISVQELSGDTIKVDRPQISEIIDARLEEIFDLVNQELARVNRDGRLPGGAVLTGGGAHLKGIASAGKEYLKLPVQVAAPKDFTGIVDRVSDPAFSTAIGLMLIDIETAPAGSSFDFSIEPIKGFLQGLISRFRS